MGLEAHCSDGRPAPARDRGGHRPVRLRPAGRREGSASRGGIRPVGGLERTALQPQRPCPPGARGGAGTGCRRSAGPDRSAGLRDRLPQGTGNDSRADGPLGPAAGARGQARGAGVLRPSLRRQGRGGCLCRGARQARAHPGCRGLVHLRDRPSAGGMASQAAGHGRGLGPFYLQSRGLRAGRTGERAHPGDARGHRSRALPRRPALPPSRDGRLQLPVGVPVEPPQGLGDPAGSLGQGLHSPG